MNHTLIGAFTALTILAAAACQGPQPRNDASKGPTIIPAKVYGYFFAEADPAWKPDKATRLAVTTLEESTIEVRKVADASKKALLANGWTVVDEDADALIVVMVEHGSEVVERSGTQVLNDFAHDSAGRWVSLHREIPKRERIQVDTARLYISIYDAQSLSLIHI